MYEKIELIISEYKLNIITKEKCLIELRNHIEQIIKQVDTKQLTLTDVVESCDGCNIQHIDNHSDRMICVKCNKSF
jgi:hypothetical protein